MAALMVNQSIFPLRPPFVEVAVCALCGEEVPTREAVAVTAPNGQWDGFAHEQCPGSDVVVNVTVDRSLL